ncbi:MAG: hypothetical protein A4S08_09195 [Proteobacteria bacterium SG_bin4]|nr:MAG: hypothetical protein A4S08_09195 [Proteobacteria bacterium SG_bin4]
MVFRDYSNSSGICDRISVQQFLPRNGYAVATSQNAINFRTLMDICTVGSLKNGITHVRAN